MSNLSDIIPLSAKDKEDWKKIQEMKARPSVHKKLVAFEQEIREAEKEQERQKAEAMAALQALKDRSSQS